MTHNHDDGEATCEVCAMDLDFDLPERLFEEAAKGKVVIFAGAGISTESRSVFPQTFYSEIRAELSDPASLADASFPDVMERYCALRSRSELIQLIRSRFDYADSYYEIRNRATAFHRELATIPFISTIVTTNWDTFFEDECGALPLVTPDDYPYWDMPGRRVLKIHGSISNVGTLVATTGDYESCYRRLRTGILGSSLQHLLATNTVVFVGYSLQDPDFVRLYRLLRKQLGPYMPHSYVVGLEDSDRPPAFLDAEFVRTSGAHFVRTMKRKLVEADLMLDDALLDEIHQLHQRVRQANILMYDKVLPRDYPAVIFAASYQNGLEHVFQRISVRSSHGEYMTAEDVHRRVHAYGHALSDARKQRQFTEVAYIEGVINGLVSLLVSPNDHKELPLYYIFGSKVDLTTEAKFFRELKRAPALHKSAYRYAERRVRNSGALVLRHPPWLSVSSTS